MAQDAKKQTGALARAASGAFESWCRDAFGGKESRASSGVASLSAATPSEDAPSSEDEGEVLGCAAVDSAGSTSDQPIESVEAWGEAFGDTSDDSGSDEWAKAEGVHRHGRAPDSPGSPAAAAAFVVEGVCVRPSRAVRIPGRFALLSRGGVSFISWMPYGWGEEGGGDRGAKDAPSPAVAYAIHPIPLLDVRAVSRSQPALGQPTLTLTLSSGVSLPPLTFRGRGDLAAAARELRARADLSRCPGQRGTWIVDAGLDPLERSLTSLGMAGGRCRKKGGEGGFGRAVAAGGTDAAGGSRAARPATQKAAEPAAATHLPTGPAEPSPLAPAPVPGAGALIAGPTAPAATLEAAAGTGSPAASARRGAEGARLRKQLADLLDRFQNLAASAAQGALGVAGGGLDDARHPGPGPADDPHAEESPAAAALGMRSVQAQAPDAAGLPLRGVPGAAAAAVVAPPPPSPAGDESLCGTFELLEASPAFRAASWASARPPPLSQTELSASRDAEGRVRSPRALLRRALEGGIDPAARADAWRAMLGLEGWGDPAAERWAVRQRRLSRYRTLRLQWATIAPEQAARNSEWRDRRSRVDKDARRTDRAHPLFARERGAGVASLRRVLLTHCVHDFDTGYCQGMSDLAAMVLVVCRAEEAWAGEGEGGDDGASAGTRNGSPRGGRPARAAALSGAASRRCRRREVRERAEAEAFWMLDALMRRVGRNFAPDGAGVHGQLESLARLVDLLDPPLSRSLRDRGCGNFFFCYRWVLVLFKREFSFDGALRFWDGLLAWGALGGGGASPARTVGAVADRPSPLPPRDPPAPPCPSLDLVLYGAAAVLVRSRDEILSAPLDLDGLLQLCIRLTGTLDPERVLADAVTLAALAGEAGTDAIAGAPGPRAARI